MVSCHVVLWHIEEEFAVLILGWCQLCRVPEVLQPYMPGGIKIIPFRKPLEVKKQAIGKK